MNIQSINHVLVKAIAGITESELAEANVEKSSSFTPGQHVEGEIQGLFNTLVNGAYCCPASLRGWHIIFIAQKNNRPKKVIASNVTKIKGMPAKNLIQAAKRWHKKVETGLAAFNARRKGGNP